MLVTETTTLHVSDRDNTLHVSDRDGERETDQKETRKRQRQRQTDGETDRARVRENAHSFIFCHSAHPASKGLLKIIISATPGMFYF